MLSVGLLYSLLTGVCWSLIAVILSCSARSKKLDIVSYSLLQSALVAAACFFCFSSPGKMEFNSGFYMLCLIILSAAVLNAFAQYLVKRSMSGGHYAPVWALAQAALIFPYLFGVILWGNKINGVNIAGFLFLLAGILLPCRRSFTTPGSWLKTALMAFVLYGILQCLYLLPSHLKELTDPGAMRPILVSFGLITGWGIIALTRREKLQFNRTIIWAAVIMAVFHTISLKTFFFALDAFGKIGLDGIGMPLMQGINLAVFGLYTLIVLREKRTPENLISELLIPAGLLCLCL